MRPRAWSLALLLALGWGPPLTAQDAGGPAEKGALVKSLILPGWGQYALGDYTSARRLIVAEAGLWLSYVLTRGAAGWYRQDYRALAALHAGASYSLKPDIYYARLGRYDSITAYNQAQLRLRNLDAVYPVGADLDWQWDGLTSRERYGQLRRASLRAAKAASFALGGLVVNRAIAVIQVLFLSRSGGAAAAYWVPLPGGGGISLSLQI